MSKAKLHYKQMTWPKGRSPEIEGEEDQPVCPNCGGADTLEDLEKLLAWLEANEEAQERARARAAMTANPGGVSAKIGSIGAGATIYAAPIPADIDPSAFVPPDTRTCIECGTVWRSKSKLAATALRARIREQYETMYDGIERLGHVGDPDWIEHLRKMSATAPSRSEPSGSSPSAP